MGVTKQAVSCYMDKFSPAWLGRALLIPLSISRAVVNQKPLADRVVSFPNKSSTKRWVRHFHLASHIISSRTASMIAQRSPSL